MYRLKKKGVYALREAAKAYPLLNALGPGCRPGTRESADPLAEE